MKYACRKTLADSRPRVRGRFAKNDEFEEPTKRAYSNGTYDDEETSSMVPELILCFKSENL
jgi:CCT motif